MSWDREHVMKILDITQQVLHIHRYEGLVTRHVSISEAPFYSVKASTKRPERDGGWWDAKALFDDFEARGFWIHQATFSTTYDTARAKEPWWSAVEFRLIDHNHDRIHEIEIARLP